MVIMKWRSLFAKLTSVGDKIRTLLEEKTGYTRMRRIEIFLTFLGTVSVELFILFYFSPVDHLLHHSDYEGRVSSLLVLLKTRTHVQGQLGHVFFFFLRRIEAINRYPKIKRVFLCVLRYTRVIEILRKVKR